VCVYLIACIKGGACVNVSAHIEGLNLLACIKSGARVCMCLHASRAERVSACILRFLRAGHALACICTH
jgi:hypothetical protein